MTDTVEAFYLMNKFGVSRSNRYKVIIPIPAKVQALANEFPSNTASVVENFSDNRIRSAQDILSMGSLQHLSLMCSQTEIPGKTINITETRYNGDSHKAGSSILYGNQQFVFKLSRDMFEKLVFDLWCNCIVNPNSKELSYPDDYVSDIEILKLDEEDKTVHAIKIHDAFPVIVNPITLSNAETNNAQELFVQFAYRKWSNMASPSEERNTPVDYTGGITESIFVSLEGSIFGPILTPILSNPAVRAGLDLLEEYTGISLDGEALNVYKQIKVIVENTTGETIERTVSLLNGMLAELGLNDMITSEQLARLTEIINGVIRKMKP